MAGYSATPLLTKLGYRDGQRALLIGVPEALPELSGFAGFADCACLPALSGAALPPGRFDLIHVFEREASVLGAGIVPLRARLDPAGMLWVSWPKRAARVPTTLTEDTIRDLALAHGLVDVKVCAVDAVWSGLKLVVPRALRGQG